MTVLAWAQMAGPLVIAIFACPPDLSVAFGHRTYPLDWGAGAVVGDAMWDRQGSVRIRVGPVNLERYNDFLPAGTAHAALRAITRFFSNDCLDFEVQLVLDRTSVPTIELDLNAKSPARLGWVSWASSVPPRHDPDDAILAL